MPTLPKNVRGHASSAKDTVANNSESIIIKRFMFSFNQIPQLLYKYTKMRCALTCGKTGDFALA
jgi:hypothetical protein